MVEETKKHKKLKKTIKAILGRCGFIVDAEVQLDIDNDGRADRSFDVCAVCKIRNSYYMLVIECKDQKTIKNIKKEISAWKRDIGLILKNRHKIKVLSNSENRIFGNVFRNIKEIKLAFAFTDKLDINKFREQEEMLEKESIVFWDHKAIKYFDKTSSTLEEWTQYEIYREFGIFEEITDTHREKAVTITQPGYPEIFLLGIHPGLLLRIGYVLRRTSNKPDAYQRAINRDRIEKISKFLSSTNVLLPNSIIIAFDSDEEIQKEIEYKEGRLFFPIRYCSAWIVDGQHRVYGFIKTRYRDWDRESNEEFKLPVIAFRNLEETLQNKTFVNINYYQKKIDPTLFCDLATVTKDLSNELTWPSLLVSELNRTGPWKDLVKISEFDTNKPITLSSFARYALLESLLGYGKKSGRYNGPLFTYAPFNPELAFESKENQEAFGKQVSLLQHFFSVIKDKTHDNNKDSDIWGNFKKYSLTKTTGVNALMLVLVRILEKYPSLDIDLESYLEPIKQVDFKSENVVRFGGGWKGFRNLANHIIRKLRRYNKDDIRLFGKRKKR